jgi:hypothetical protein
MDEEVIMANTSNISVGGVCLHLNQRLLPNTKVELRIEFPKQEAPFKCRGMVLRCEAEKNNFFKIAVRFEPLDDFRRAVIQRETEALLAQQKKV